MGSVRSLRNPECIKEKAKRRTNQKAAKSESLRIAIPSIRTIKVELPGKARKIGVFEIEREDVASKLFDVLDYKIVSGGGPSGNGGIATVNHVICLCSIEV
jgi:hypothetical protein